MIVILLVYSFVIGYGVTAIAYSARQWLSHSNLFLRTTRTYGALVSNGKLL
jgi:hypothetical protein